MPGPRRSAGLQRLGDIGRWSSWSSCELNSGPRTLLFLLGQHKRLQGHREICEGQSGIQPQPSQMSFSPEASVLLSKLFLP